jgi:hypothetical protein
MSLSGRTLPTAAAVIIFSLALFGVYTNIYPITDSKTQSATQLVIPVLEPGDEPPATKKSGDDTPTPTLLPTPAQYTPSEAMETATDPWVSERMEASAKAPFVEEPKKLDEAINKDGLPRGALSQPASRPADAILPKIESPPVENTPTFSQNPDQPSTEPDTGVTPQPAPSQIAPPDPLAGTDTTSPQPSLDLPMDTQTSPQTPPSLPTATETSSQPRPDLPAVTGTPPPPPPRPPGPTPSSQLPANS